MPVTPEPLKSGRYKVRFRHDKRATSETFDRLKDAQQFAGWLAALGPQGALDKLFDGEQAATMPTLDDIARDHVAHLEGAGDAHRIKQRRLWERTWGPRIGAVRADLITRDRLIGALSDLARNGRAPGRGYSEKSLKNQRGLLHGVLDRAVDQGHLTKHPGLKMKLPQVTVAIDMDDEDDPAEMVCLTFAEFLMLYEAMAEHYRPLLRFLVGTGARWGEAVVLRRSDVDLAGGTARIRRALKWSPDGNHTIGPPKTKKSRRTVTLPNECIEDLRELVAGRTASDLVFTAPRGGRISHRTFWSDSWRPAIWRAQHCPEHTEPGCGCGRAHPERCKIHQGKTPPPCGHGLLTSPRIHDMRHTHASWLLGANPPTPIHVVQARLGHESIQTTVDTYSHLLPDAQLLAAAAAQAVFSSPALALPPA